MKNLNRYADYKEVNDLIQDADYPLSKASKDEAIIKLKKDWGIDYKKLPKNAFFYTLKKPIHSDES